MRLAKKDLAIGDCEIKFSGGASHPTRFSGYASVFNGTDSYGDTIAPGAYQRTITERAAKGSVPMLFAHDRRQLPPGKWLSIVEDQKGLFVEGELTPGNAEAKNLEAAMRHGTINGMSIGFYVYDGGEQIDQKTGSRTLTAIDLREISIVPMPADDAARIDLSSVKAELEDMANISDMEEFLRDAGNFSRSTAKAFISRIRTVLRDAGTESDQIGQLKAELSRRDAVIATLQADKLCAEFRLPT